MRKSKILIVALIGLLLTGGLVLAGCMDDPNPNCSSKGECFVKSGANGVFLGGKDCSNSSCAVNGIPEGTKNLDVNCNC
jgi:hypothetical protein